MLQIWKPRWRNCSISTKNGALLRRFFPWLFLFFIVLNAACYWLAMYTAYPTYMETPEARQYLLLQFPVGFLGSFI